METILIVLLVSVILVAVYHFLKASASIIVVAIVLLGLGIFTGFLSMPDSLKNVFDKEEIKQFVDKKHKQIKKQEKKLKKNTCAEPGQIIIGEQKQCPPKSKKN